MTMKSPVVRCFFGDIIPFDPDSEALNLWILHVADTYEAKCRKINIVFSSDEELLLLNQQYLNHDTYTDIITFPYHQPGKPIEAELFISVQRVKENAAENNIHWQDELHRVIIHGVLHLLGFDDQTPEQQKEMRLKEDYCLSLRP